MLETISIEVYDVGDHEPADGSLVVAWNGNGGVFPLPAVLEYRKRKGAFYDFQSPARPTRFFYLSDLVGLSAVQAIRDRWDLRDDKKPRTLAR